MIDTKLLLPAGIISIMFSIIATNTTSAQPVPGDPSASAEEICFGETTPTVEFVCKMGSFYRAIDCDTIIDKATGECLWAKCNVEEEECAGLRESFARSQNVEPLCYACSSVFAPQFTD